MKLAWIKTPKIVKKIFSNYHWDIPSDDSVYLTFDDGPIPQITPWVLNQLETHKAKATFFCVGENIQKHPEIFQQVIDKGHAVGNHTYHHLNAWKIGSRRYLKDIDLCQKTLLENHPQLTTQLFRPPYGKVRPLLTTYLRGKGYKIIMWDVLSADYDITLSKEQCLENVIKNIQPGSIIVFHDSLKAFSRLEYVLPNLLDFTSKMGYKCKTIS